MKTSHCTKRLIFAPFAIAGLIALLSTAVMLLWNNILPAVLNVHTINFWQAMGIFVLSKILFGFKPRPGGASMLWAHKMKKKFQKMTPEEKEKFKAEMQHRFASWKIHSNPFDPKQD